MLNSPKKRHFSKNRIRRKILPGHYISHWARTVNFLTPKLVTLQINKKIKLKVVVKSSILHVNIYKKAFIHIHKDAFQC